MKKFKSILLLLFLCLNLALSSPFQNKVSLLRAESDLIITEGTFLH